MSAQKRGEWASRLSYWGIVFAIYATRETKTVKVWRFKKIVPLNWHNSVSGEKIFIHNGPLHHCQIRLVLKCIGFPMLGFVSNIRIRLKLKATPKMNKEQRKYALKQFIFKDLNILYAMATLTKAQYIIHQVVISMKISYLPNSLYIYNIYSIIFHYPACENR